MRTPLAWLNLWHEKARTLTAVAGTAFAVVLVLMQLGFFGAVVRTATLVYDQIEFDVVLTSANYRQMLKPGLFDRARLNVAAALPEVAETSAASLMLQLYRNPDDGTSRAILVVGLDPTRDNFRILTPELRTAILRDDCVLFDELSRPEFGPRRVGLHAQVSGHALTIVGLFRMGIGFGADGTIVCNEPTFAAVCFPRSIDDVTLGLVRLRPGSDADDVVRRLRTILPADVAVQTRADFFAAEREFWIVKTSVGVIFGLGVLVALLVGTAIVYQVLSADVAKRMPEFATLKAMGYSRGYLTRVVLVQAATIGLIGFVPGWLISLVLYDVTRRQAHLQMVMGNVLPPVVLVLSVLMCCISGRAALAKVHRVDPAELFV